MSTHRESSPAIDVLVADGQALLRAGLSTLLAQPGDITVVAEAGDADELLDAAERANPDVIILSVDLPGPGAVETTRRILALCDCGVLVVGRDDFAGDVCAVLRAGARGALLGTTDAVELIRAVRVVAAGHALVSPSVTRGLIAQLKRVPKSGLPATGLLDELTDREREVVALVAHGLDNEQIATRLVVSPATAKTHVSRAMVKLGVRDRAQLVVLAYESGLVLPPSPQSTPQVIP
jgi:DNA-binding NarL/FixJ family response regulator